MPTMPFGRSTAANKPQTSASQNSTCPYPQNAASSAQFNGSAAPKSGRQYQQRIPSDVPMAAQLNWGTPSNRAANGPSSQPIRQDAGPRLPSLPTAALPIPVAPSRIPNSSAVPPWQAKPAANPLPNRSASAPAEQSTAADRLVAQAHELSERAKGDAEYTQIAEICSQAEASEPSPATAQFAKNLRSWALNRRGQLKAEAGQDQEAILDFTAAVEADPTCWRAIHNRGVLVAQAGQFEKAFDDFARTIELNPKFAKAYSNRGALFMVANNLKDARQDYDHALALDPSLAVAHRGDGRVCQLMGDTNSALAHYNASIQLAPNDAYAIACRADLLTDLGRYAEANAEYNRAIDADPKSTQAQCGSAWLLATCPDRTVRKPDLAIQRAQTVIELGGDSDAVSFDTLAAAQANAGDYEAAMSSVRHAIALAPAEERDAYKQRFLLYQQAKPYRISPVGRVQQASYQSTGENSAAIR
jgi:tetratricopeptide (TPR) repeat protein